MNSGSWGVSMVMAMVESTENRHDAARARASIVASSGSFEDVYAAQFVPMVRLATLLCGRVEIARDVVQDAFVSLHVKWSGVSHPVAYLRQSVVNGCRTQARWERRRRGRPTQEEPTVDAEVAELNDVLGRLPHRQRAAVVLRYYEGRTEAEIAAILRCRPGSVGPLISRGLKAMRRELDTEGVQ